MKVYIVLSIHNKHLKVKSFIYWHRFAAGRSRQVAVFKWREKKFLLEKFSSGKAKKNKKTAL